MSVSEREYDFIIFGATGFTGQFVVSEVQRIAKTENVKWAVSGRNQEKLRKVINKQCGESETVLCDIIIADVNDFQSLLLMSKQAKIVLDCVGPYRFYGEPVVKACIESKTHYIDVCGEPKFLEETVLKYNDSAAESGVYVVSACGFDSIPSDIGVLYAKKEFPGTINGINAYLKVQSGPAGSSLHFGTYESAVYGLGDESGLHEVRQKLAYKKLPLVGNKLSRHGAIHYNSDLRSYAIPFLGADVSIVRRSQRYLYEKLNEPPIQYSMYSCINGLFSIFMLIVFGSLFKLLASISWGRSLLLKHPKFFSAGYFSHEGPTKEQMDGTSFSITMYVEGYSDGSSTLNRSDVPDKKIVVRVSGPEPGYVATPLSMVQAGLVILKEKEALPDVGGVYSPGAAFFKTTLIERLQQSGLKFEVLSQ